MSDNQIKILSCMHFCWFLHTVFCDETSSRDGVGVVVRNGELVDGKTFGIMLLSICSLFFSVILKKTSKSKQ